MRQIDVGERRLGSQGQRGLELPNRFVDPAQLKQGCPQIVAGGGAVRIAGRGGSNSTRASSNRFCIAQA